MACVSGSCRGSSCVHPPWPPHCLSIPRASAAATLLPPMSQMHAAVAGRVERLCSCSWPFASQPVHGSNNTKGRHVHCRQPAPHRGLNVVWVCCMQPQASAICQTHNLTMLMPKLMVEVVRAVCLTRSRLPPDDEDALITCFLLLLLLLLRACTA